MYGLGIVKGLGITLKHFINTFVDDLKYFPNSALSEEAFARRQGPEGAGIFTVEYPEQKLKIPENFRFIPFLVTDYTESKESADFDRAQYLEQNRCTSCGICAKVCPPQCIWIVRTNDPDTGKPIPQPAEFFIDTDICMNCGYCAEFCPFDAIKMDHDYELADYNRDVAHVHDLDRLLKPVSYYASIRPNWNAQEEAARIAAEEEKQRKAKEKARVAAEKAAAKEAAAKAKAEEAAKAPAPEAAANGDQPQAATKPKRSPEEIKAQREAMMARRAAKAAESGEAKPPAEAQAAAPEKAVETETRTAQVAVEAVKSDDLTKIEGIGPKISGILKAAGILTFAKLAETEVDTVKEVLQNSDLRIKRDPTTWPEQAELAAAGKWAELETLQDSLHGGRRVS